MGIESQSESTFHNSEAKSLESTIQERFGSPSVPDTNQIGSQQLHTIAEEKAPGTLTQQNVILKVKSEGGLSVRAQLVSLWLGTAKQMEKHPTTSKGRWMTFKKFEF